MTFSSERPWIKALGLSRRPKSARRSRIERTARRVAVEPLEGRTLLASNWTALTNLAPEQIGTMMLLTDGTVIAQGNGGSLGGASNRWYKLTPDSTGSYANGTWTALANMSTNRLYFGSNVLQNGNVFVMGGEYSGPTGQENDTNTGEIYNPTTNSWSSVPNYPQNNFGDDPSILLPNGNILTGYIIGPQTYIYNVSTNSWSQTGTKLDNDQSDEEGFLKLPDDSILDYEVFYNTAATPGHARSAIPLPLDNGSRPEPSPSPSPAPPRDLSLGQTPCCPMATSSRSAATTTPPSTIPPPTPGPPDLPFPGVSKPTTRRESCSPTASSSSPRIPSSTSRQRGCSTTTTSTTPSPT